MKMKANKSVSRKPSNPALRIKELEKKLAEQQDAMRLLVDQKDDAVRQANDLEHENSRGKLLIEASKASEDFDNAKQRTSRAYEGYLVMLESEEQAALTLEQYKRRLAAAAGHVGKRISISRPL